MFARAYRVWLVNGDAGLATWHAALTDAEREQLAAEVSRLSDAMRGVLDWYRHAFDLVVGAMNATLKDR